MSTPADELAVTDETGAADVTGTAADRPRTKDSEDASASDVTRRRRQVYILKHTSRWFNSRSRR